MKSHYMLIPLLILFYGYGYTQSKMIPYHPPLIFKEEPLKVEQEIEYPKNTKRINLKSYPPKDKVKTGKCIMESKINIPKVNAIIKEEDYYEKDK